jgi:hypothetical protein
MTLILSHNTFTTGDETSTRATWLVGKFMCLVKKLKARSPGEAYVADFQSTCEDQPERCY